MSSDLEQRILEIVRSEPGLKAKDIAQKLGVDRTLVNSALYGHLRNQVQQNKSYRWFPRETSGVERRTDQEPKILNTPLARLCRYYLDCLSHDDLGGVGEFATSMYGDPNYIELKALPMVDESGQDPFDSEAGHQLLNKIRRDRNRQTILLGYPVRLNLVHSRRGWEGFVVEPLLLFSFRNADSGHGKPVLTEDLPQINFRALRALSNAGETSIMEEAILLTEELGLGNAMGDQPDIDELLGRLREIRPEWDWQEEINPYLLSSGKSLSTLNQQGIYNRGILVAAERSPYTKGLESELGLLQSIEESVYSTTALGSWLNGRTVESPAADQQPLLEVLPLNSEQRQAVRQALTNPLTVITGPPGTGKSQVVTSILVNAAWQGKTVLFASKNNKAVDVVEIRANALGPRPILMRLGANEYQSKLAEYLTSLLAATATTTDYERYRECEVIHNRLQQQSEALDDQIQRLIDLRNEVDHLEQQIEQIRQEVGGDVFSRLRLMDQAKLQQVAVMLAAMDQANRAKQSFIARLLWPFFRHSRFTKLKEAGMSFQQVSQYVGLPLPDRNPDPSSIEDWIKYGNRLAKRQSQVPPLHQYSKKLMALTEAPSLEELSKQRRQLTEDLTANSEALWRAWLQVQPSRLNQGQRRLLDDYCALVRLIVSANDENRQLGRDVFRRYYQLFPQITALLSCWAVTSLSARGRLPFTPNFFDILVVDEASQCDIASVLPLLFRARQVVVIGDPMQLRHISTLPRQQDQQLLNKHELIDNYPGWAYSIRSLFDLASGLCRNEDIVSLRDHHRSHADIIEFSNEAFYEGRLRVATRYDQLCRPHLGSPAVRWVNVQGKAVRPANGGAINEEEAKVVVEEIDRLVSQGYRGTIGVVSPFRAQANRIRDLVYNHKGLATHIADTDFLADTVHKFQGDERDVMIFSPVVATGISDGALGFLRSNPNLFNVAITRARAALVVVGNKGAALSCDVDYLARFAAYIDMIGKRSEQPAVISDLGPEYPTVSNPEQVSEWERIFYRALYRKGIRPIPQYSVEKYKLDFAIIDGERLLNVEIDGEHYHRNWDGELCRRDQIRNQRLLELGWDVMRFWVYQVRDELDRCLERVREWTICK